jgi:hypothetical protein
MIGLKIYNEWLDLTQDASFIYSASSPLFLAGEMDKIMTSFVSDIRLPLTPGNRKILNFPDEIDNYQELITEADVEVYFRGFYIFTGAATINDVTDKEITMKIVINPYKDIKDMPISELDLDVYTFADLNAILAHAKDTAENPLDYDDHAFFPVSNPRWWSAEALKFFDPDVGIIQNFYDWVLEKFGSNKNNSAAMPFVRIDYLVSKIIEAMGYEATNEFQTTDELKQLYLYNNISLYHNDDWGLMIDLRRHLPDVTGSEFLKWYMKTFCLYPDIDTNYSTFTIRHVDDVLQNAEIIDWTDLVMKEKGITKDSSTPNIVGYDQPDYVEIDTFTEVDKSSDMIGTGSPPGVYYVIAQNTFYRKISNTPGDVIELARQFRPHVINEASTNQPFMSKLTPLPMKRAISVPPPGGGAPDINIYPEAKYEGYVSGESQGEKCGLHMMFYRGMQPNIASKDYPLGSSCIYRADELPITGLEHSLLWNHEKGMYHKFWKQWLYFLRNRRIVKRKFLINIDDFLKFRWHNKIKVENVYYFCNSFKAAMGSGRKIEVEAELSTILYT